MSGTKIVTQSAETKKSALYRKTFLYHLLSAPPTVKKSEAFTKAFCKPPTDFLETWGAQLTFAIGTLENTRVDVRRWRAEELIDQDALAQQIDYMSENGLDSLVDELMTTGVR